MLIIRYATENALFSSAHAPPHTHTHTHTHDGTNNALHGAQVVLIMQVCIKTMFMLFLGAENNKLENVLVCMAHQFSRICFTASSIFSNS
jgi:hypothetical protein